VSRFEPYKHHRTVISAVLGLEREGVPVTLELVGSGGYSAHAVEKQLEAEDPEHTVITNHGAVNYADLPGLYHRADALIFASSCENLPNILLEAMAAGLPIVVANRGVMPEVVGNAGFYFDPESVTSLSSAIREMLGNQQLRAERAAAALERVRGRTWAECASRTFEFLSLIGRQRVAARSTPASVEGTRVPPLD
jgi:glycosyltransferase involved in cell wall biosynthesis